LHFFDLSNADFIQKLNARLARGGINIARQGAVVIG